jgi:hypothetical protein
MAFNIVTQNIEQYANLASFPATGESNILYIAEDTDTAYYWDSLAYSSISGAGGGGDMTKVVYDTTGVNADCFDYANAIGIEQITGGIITPAQLTGNINDYNPTGFNTANLIRQDIDANNREITGILAPAVGVNRIIKINNISSAGKDLKFTHNDAASLAENRFLLRDNGDRTIRPNEIAIFYYDHIQSRWISLNRIG